MDTKEKPQEPKMRPLGNESPDPFSPTLPPGSLHERLRPMEDDPAGDPAPALDDPAAPTPPAGTGPDKGDTDH